MLDISAQALQIGPATKFHVGAMKYNILILGASYGSLLGTKLLMAGHDVTLVCRQATAALINTKGTEVRIRLKGEDTHRSILSPTLPGDLHAATPGSVDLSRYDMVALAMQEPQYSTPEIRTLLSDIAARRLPCLSIMNMPVPPYLARIPAIDPATVASAFIDAEIWEAFAPGCMSLCSPDPQAFRPPDEAGNVLHVGLPTNFKAAPFDNPAHDAILQRLESDIAAVQLDGKDVPVKLRRSESLFVPLAKWPMLLTGNYRCVTDGAPRAIRDAVHGDLALSREIYDWVAALVVRLGGDAADLVPFDKYARAAEGLLKPSSAARAIAGGASHIERVDQLVQAVALSMGETHPEVDRTVDRVDGHLSANRRIAA